MLAILYLNLLVILLIDFHVHFWILISKRAHLKGSSERKETSTKTLGGGGGGGGGGGAEWWRAWLKHFEKHILSMKKSEHMWS